MTFKHWVAVAIAGATVAAFAVISTAAADSGNGRSRSALADAILGTVRYHDIGAAKADGYGLLKDAKGIACIEMTPMPGMAMGAMGIHYVKGSLVGDGAVMQRRPRRSCTSPSRMDGFVSSRSSTSCSRPIGTRRTARRRRSSGSSSTSRRPETAMACRPSTRSTRGSGSTIRAECSRCGIRT